jgi:divalent metal cation (Fe/Co/Zn/Cd) transporter
MDCHDVQVREVEGRIVVSCHATLDGSLPIKRVHDITQEVEDFTRRQFPQIFRFTIHTEPPEAH